MKLVSSVASGVASHGALRPDVVHGCGPDLARRYTSLRDDLGAGAVDEVERAADRLAATTPRRRHTATACTGLHHGSRRRTELPRSPVRGLAAGYSCFNDGTARDRQQHTQQCQPGKNVPRRGAFGPTLVAVGEVPALPDATIQTRVNGELRQDAGRADLPFGVPALRACMTEFVELGPGGVVTTGTPGGVGTLLDPPRQLDAGDEVERRISGFGTPRNPVVADR